MTNDRHHEIIHAADEMVALIKGRIKTDPGETFTGDGFMEPEGTRYRSWYLGSVLGFNPSGKYYTPWTTNQNPEDVVEDGIFWERVHETLNKELPDHWLEHGEGDPLDLYIVTTDTEEPA